MSIHSRSIETEDDIWKERYYKFESPLKALEKLVNSLAAEQDAPRRNPNVSRIQEVLREIQDNTSGRHFGVIKTLHKTRKRFYWDRLRADVEKWCRECQACGARNRSKTEQGKSVTGRTLRFPCDILFGRQRASPTNSEARLESV
ncbi:hypothetical protein AVEN_68400-1 [Araneus ventricosus]|uniref:Integrase zinc-binding domain-containing protein n=1 Tax=Araneus ventricosus TaxID=182803 RepID=A0A4Y2T888_ARAVE|nr:hypothetical protein AVEN_68400-1 [Araneus ventricosus]